MLYILYIVSWTKDVEFNTQCPVLFQADIHLWELEKQHWVCYVGTSSND